MTQATSPIGEPEIKRYLFAEMTDEERLAIEERMLLDDRLFYEAADLENELVDLYAHRKLAGEDLTRFERSLEQIPERRQKIANAVALQTLIAEERPAETPIAAPANQTFRSRLAEFFTVKTPAFGYAMSVLVILFAAAVLLLQNNRQNQELARLQSERQQYEQLPAREAELKNQIADLRGRESDLQNRIDTERETVGELTDEIAAERQNRRRAESELEKIRQQANISRPPVTAPPAAPTIATIFLKSGIGTRGTSGAPGADVPKVDVAPTTKRIAVQIALSAETKLDERFSVQLNGKTVADNLKARAADGRKSLQIAVAPNDLFDGENKLTVFNAAGALVGEQYLTTLKK